MRARGLGFFALLLATVSVGILSRGSGVDDARAQTPVTPAPGAARPLPPPPPPPPVTLNRMDIAIEIRDLTAFTTLNLTFRNASDRPQEATLLFPVPPDVAIGDFTLTVDGQTLEGELLGSAEAASVYTGIVQRQRDPALLEYVGSNVVRARVFPVPPRGESRLTLSFTQILNRENAAVRYRLPLSTGTDVGPTLPLLTIAARVTASGGVRSLFSPTQEMRFARESDTVMSASYEERDAAPRGTFELDALFSDDPIGAGLISYRAGSDDGFFMLWLAPQLRQEAVVEKDVILVLDISGSMQGRKIDQAKAALKFVLNRLNPGDRFNVVVFSSSVDRLATPLLPVSQVPGALAYVDGLRAEGGTNIDEALRTALGLADPERLTTLLFLTDGEPTAGETGIDRILEHARSAAGANTRLFVFGVGDDVNTVLLDGLAVQNHGDVTYVRPADDVEAAVSTLYGRISSPQLTGLGLDFGDAGVYDAYPRPLPDLFGGQTLFITGRYHNPGPVSVRLTGSTRDGAQSFSFDDLRLTGDDRRAPYLPRLWASRKVGSLLRDIRLRGEARSRELIDEVRALGLRYGIVTPYTSFLVQEPNRRPPVAAPTVGATAVAVASAAGALAQATPAPVRTATPLPIARPGAPLPADAQLELRYVGDKTFVKRGDVWTDTLYQAGTDTVKVSFASDAYFALLAQHPELGPYFAIGERVIVVLDDVAYEVTE